MAVHNDKYFLSPPPSPYDAPEVEVNDWAGDGWIEAHDPAAQKALSILVRSIISISMDRFLRALAASYESMKEEFYPDALVPIAPGKSNQWVAALAHHRLGLQGQFCKLGEKEARELVKDGGFFESLDPKSWPRQIILFDDASYSGTQIYGHVQAIKEYMETHEHKHVCTILVCVPFMTQKAFKMLSKLQRTSTASPPPLGVPSQRGRRASRITLKIGLYERMQTVFEIFDSLPLERQALSHLYKGTAYESIFEEETGVTVTFPHHKLPNEMSFFGPLAEVAVYPASPHTPHLHRIIPEITPIYKTE